jgi:Ser/Thr protein kinase RdoA (MazF antagonist)
MQGSTTPYADLTPPRILDALDSVGVHGDGRLLALGSYENRVYQVWRDEGPSLVAKFYRPGRFTDAEILEEHAFCRALADAEIPVVPPIEIAATTLFAFESHRFALYERRGGRAPPHDDRNTLEWLGRYNARINVIGAQIHVIGAHTPFAHRPALDIASFGEAPRDFLRQSAFVPDDLRDVYFGVVEQALDGVRRGYERAGDVVSLRLHGDCHGGNVLWTDDGPHFVDFDDARTGPAMQDLWMLLSGDRAAMERGLEAVLTGYEMFRPLDRRELFLIEPLRTLRLIHYAAWIARRWDDPAFPAAFPWFASHRYWQDRILELREQIALLDEPPLAA